MKYHGGENRRNRLAVWIAQHLPRLVAYHCAVRVAAEATCGVWGHLEVPKLTAMDALGRWDGSQTIEKWEAEQGIKPEVVTA